MLKALDVHANYQPSRRSESWIKIKKCAPADAPCGEPLATLVSPIYSSLSTTTSHPACGCGASGAPAHARACGPLPQC